MRTTKLTCSARNRLIYVFTFGLAVVLIAIVLFAQADDDPELHVVKTGLGSGTVTSSPAGISCGATCDATFGSSVFVTLTATPAAGSTFGG